MSWQSPTGHNVVGRRWDDAPPAWVMYEAIVLEQDDWLTLLTGEKPAVVARSRRPDRVLLQPWLDTSLTAVELHIGGYGFGGSRIWYWRTPTNRSCPTRRAGGPATGWVPSSARASGGGWMSPAAAETEVARAGA